MIRRISKRFLSLLLVAVMVLSFLPTITLPAFAADTALSGLSDENIGLTTDKSDAWSATGTTITGSVKGTSGTCSSSSSESTLTITNNKAVPAILSFSYKITQNDNSGTIQVAGTSVTADGTYSGELAAGASIKVYLKSAAGAYTTAVELSGISLIANVQATTTFQPAENGSYTVDGVEITEETTKTQQSTVAYTLVATPAAGYKFLGWYSVTEGKYLSTDTPASMYFDIDQTITAVFTVEKNPIFDVSGAKFTDLNEANEYAATNSLSKIVLVSDGTLNSGSYTISSGVTLLIPFDSAYTCYTTTPANTGNVWTAPSVYKTLTMAEGASITVDGAISVSAKHYAYGQTGAGAPCGKYGYIYMNSGSSITVNSGGGLYVYGYVSGDGTVTAKSGATVYENMQICDFRGGSATSSMNNNAQKIFPLNQYFIQNIEAKLILESGADEYIYTSIYAASTATSTAVHFIGNEGAMFSVEEGGYFTKQYLPDKDRLEISVSGNAKINNLTLKVMGITVSSSNYVLPINNCMTLNVLSGTTQITQDVALLAGVQVNIANGATVQVNEGASLYVYDADEWTAANYASNAKFKTVLYSPTRTYTRKASDLIDARIDINGTLQSDGYVYTTAGGADIISSEGTGKFILTNGAGTETVTYMYKDYTTDYDEIPITPAKLHNGSQYVGTEEEYTTTDGAAAGSGYKWWNSDSKWHSADEVDTITITFHANNGEGSMEPQTVESGVDVVLTGNGFVRGHYTFKEWNTAPDGSGTSYANGATVNFTEDTTLYAIWTPDTYTIAFDANGGEGSMEAQTFTYGVDTRLTKNTFTLAHYMFTGWNTSPDGTGTPYTDEAAISDLTEDVTLYAQWKFWNGWLTDENGTTYYADGVQAYFSAWATIDGNTYYFDEAGYIVKGIYEVVPQGGTEKARCVFGENGVFRSDITGAYDAGTETYWLNAGIIEEFPGLKRVVDSNGHIHYYYFGEDGKAVKNGTYKVEKNNGLPLPCYSYAFDEYGVIIHDEDTSKNGICEGDGSWFYYIDGVKVGEGLLRIDGSYYYARTSSGKIVRNCSYWITKTNGLPIQPGTYRFDADGKMILNGFVTENGATYYYADGILAKGFTKIGEDYYLFNAGSGKMYQDATLWVGDNSYGIRGGWYAFGTDGKLIKTGFVTGGGYTYYYRDTELVKGFTKIGEDYYLFNAGNGRMYKDATLWVGNNDYGIVGGMYYFGTDGKMVVPDLENGTKAIVSADGKLYFTIDGARMVNGLYELDGEYYYAQSNGELAVNKSIYVTTDLLSGTGWYGFDADGKLIKDGFIVGADGYTYYYSNGVRAKGFTKIGEDYYLFNTGSGKMYKDATLWVGSNDYGIVGGMYYFDANGQMRMNG